jgi:hypothetical protein
MLLQPAWQSINRKIIREFAGAWTVSGYFCDNFAGSDTTFAH